MDDEDIKALGLEARAFKASHSTRLTRPSNDLLILWFVSKIQICRKRDVQVFDGWLRSKDGVAPYPSPNGLQDSIFPSWNASETYDTPLASSQVYLANVTGKLWAVSVKGYLDLQANAHRLPLMPTVGLVPLK